MVKKEEKEERVQKCHCGEILWRKVNPQTYVIYGTIHPGQPLKIECPKCGELVVLDDSFPMRYNNNRLWAVGNFIDGNLINKIDSFINKIKR